MPKSILIQGDARRLPLAAGSVHAIVTDPPYELGFMGKKWDASGVAYDVAVWREVLRVLKPGGHLLAFGGTRTHHRMVCAIEDAGFEVRDEIQWLYGSGFPKSADVSKSLDKAAGVEREVVGRKTGRAATPVSDMRGGRMHAGGVTPGTYDASAITAPATDAARQWSGWGTALKPACEPICVARKPLIGTVVENVLKHGCGGINVDGCRVGMDKTTTHVSEERFNGTHYANGKTYKPKFVGEYDNPAGRFPANLILTIPEDEYILRDDVKPEQLRRLAKWMDENAKR